MSMFKIRRKTREPQPVALIDGDTLITFNEEGNSITDLKTGEAKRNGTGNIETLMLFRPFARVVNEGDTVEVQF